MCAQLALLPKDGILVGDNPVSDIQGAAQVGMYTVFIPGPLAANCNQADALCTNFQELVT